MTKAKFIFYLLMLLVISILGLIKTIEATTIDFESLDNALNSGECVWGEMPEIQFTLYYCKEENISYCKQ